jgi:hypothetical protein
MLLADGFDKAFIGVGLRAGQEEIVVYDFDICVAILCERDNMDLDDAIEFMYYNVVGAWMGEGTPLFVQRMNNIGDLHDVDVD